MNASTFSDVFERVRTRSDAFGSVWMRSDPLGCISVRWDALGHFRKFSDFLIFSDDFDIFGCFLNLGANKFVEIRIPGLTISVANYSADALNMQIIMIFMLMLHHMTHILMWNAI